MNQANNDKYYIKYPDEVTNYDFQIYTPSGVFLVSTSTHSNAIDVVYELNNLLLFKQKYDDMMKTIEDISKNS